jgi:hypothetical protein
MYLMVDVVSQPPDFRIYADNVQVVNHVGAYGAKEFQPGPYYGPFDSPADYHPYNLNKVSPFPQTDVDELLIFRLADGSYA